RTLSARPSCWRAPRRWPSPSDSDREDHTMKHGRRDLLRTTLFGAGGLGLRALATGLPVSFLARPLAARADDYLCLDKNRAQYLILSASSAGDPMNCNVPGTYDFPDIAHAADPRMAPTPLSLGGKTV